MCLLTFQVKRKLVVFVYLFLCIKKTFSYTILMFLRLTLYSSQLCNSSLPSSEFWNKFTRRQKTFVLIFLNITVLNANMWCRKRHCITQHLCTQFFHFCPQKRRQKHCNTFYMSYNVPVNTSHNYDVIASFFTWILPFLKRREILPTGAWFLHPHFGGQKPKKSHFKGHNMNFRDCPIPQRKLTLKLENYSWTTFHSQIKTKKPKLHSGGHTKIEGQLRYARNTTKFPKVLRVIPGKECWELEFN